jgi:cytidine deaminase
MSQLDNMIEKARQAMALAYAPYSKFQVGACIRTPADRYYSGCNIENVSYPLTHCAEASAITQMVLGGEQTIAEIAVISSGKKPCYPCGACRQRLSEFATPDTKVHVCDPNGLYQTLLLSELLPYTFNRDNLNP